MKLRNKEINAFLFFTLKASVYTLATLKVSSIRSNYHDYKCQ